MEKRGIMTNRERVEALLRHEKPDRVPIWPIGGEAFSMLQAGGDIAHTFTRPEACLAAHRKASQDFDWVFWPRICFAAMYCTPWGGKIKHPSGEFSYTPTVVRRPIQTPDEAIQPAIMPVVMPVRLT